MHPNVLITDFDGTVTERDFYLLIAERYMGSDAMGIWDSYRAGEISHFQAMQSFFSQAPEDESELQSLLDDTDPDPKFAESCRTLRESGWDLIVVSAGSSWYIERILAKAGVYAVVHSNPGRIVSGKGLMMDYATDTPFFCADVGVNKSAVVQDALDRYQEVAFAGDGPPDVSPALLVTPERRFARGFLAEELRRRGEAYLEFGAWSDVAVQLLRMNR